MTYTDSCPTCSEPFVAYARQSDEPIPINDELPTMLPGRVIYIARCALGHEHYASEGTYDEAAGLSFRLIAA